MSVVELEWQEPHVVASMSWQDAPEHTFRLFFNRWGDLEGFSAFKIAGQEGAGLTARDLRKAPIGEMQRVLLAHLTHLGRFYEALSPEQEAAMTSSASETLIALATWAHLAKHVFLVDAPTPAGASPLYKYAAIAAKYLQLHQGGAAKPVQVLADQEGLSPRTIRNYLFQAREKGLLTSKGRGVAGGQLTDKAKEILSGQH